MRLDALRIGPEGVGMAPRARWLSAVLLIACGGAAGDPDAGASAPPDAGVDAGPSDAGTRDARVADGSLTDAATSDAGVEETDAAPPTLAVVLGTGQLELEPLPEDGTLELYRGGQGGVHLYVAARIYGVTPDALIIRYGGSDPDTGERIFIPTARSLDSTDVLDEGDSIVRAGDRLILDETRVTQVDLIGRQVRIDVLVEAPGGPLTDEAIVTVVDEI